MSKFGVHVATWNVCNSSPPDDLSSLVGLPESEYVIDILAIGLQEVPWSICSTSDPLSHDNLWLQRLTSILGKSEFVLLSASQMCGSFLAIFVQRGVLPFVSMVETAHTATGFFGLFGTKGVVSTRFQLHGTWFSFVNSHLAAHTWNLPTRVWEYDTILDYHCYADQTKILDHDYVFWFGDLNFRLEGVTRDKVEDAIATKAYSELFEYDQLTRFQREGLIFTDFEESGLYFPPTYKKPVGSSDKYVIMPYRLPSWCDRILYSSASNPYSIHILDYADLPVLSSSDHTPVFLQANVAIPHPASNSLVRFGPVNCESIPTASPTDSSIIMSCNFSFAGGFKSSPKDSIALYRKYFARLDDDVSRWPASEFLPLRVLRLDLTAEIDRQLQPGFYCLVYHHYNSPSDNKSRVAGISDYFAIGDVSSDEEDFGEEVGFADAGESGDSTDAGGVGDGDDAYDERECIRASSSARCRSAAYHGRFPPRPKSARGHYDDLSLTPGAASGSSDASFSVTPTVLTPNLPATNAWSASPGDPVVDLLDNSLPIADSSVELGVDDIIDDNDEGDDLDDDDDDDEGELLDDEDADEQK